MASGGGTFQRKCNEFMEQSTFHGLSEISAASGTRRAFHTILVVISYGIAFYGFYQIVRGFLFKPVITSITVEDTDTLDIPDIIICPFNRLNQDFFDRNNISSELAMLAEWTFFWTNPDYPFMQKPPETLLRLGQEGELFTKLQNVMDNMGMTMEEFIANASFQCEDLFKRCYSYVNRVNCCEVVEPVFLDMGRCFRFPSQKQAIGGNHYGISLALKLPTHKFTYSETMLQNDGLMVKLVEKGRGHECDAIFAPMSVYMLVQLQATKMEFMTDPGRYDCKHYTEKNYSHYECLRTCKLKNASDACHCRYITDTSNRSLPVCGPREMLACVYMQMQEGTTSAEGECRKQCRPPCNHWKYTPTLTYTPLPEHVNRNAENFNESEHDDDVDVFLDVYFDKLTYTLLKHRMSMTPDNLVADIGGQVGLWMGGSILSIIHLFAFLAFCARPKDATAMEIVNIATTAQSVGMSFDAQKVEEKDAAVTYSKTSRETSPINVLWRAMGKKENAPKT